MSGNTVGSLVGAGIGFLITGSPAGAKWGFFIGGQIGGYVDPQKIKGPRLSDASRQTSMEGIPIPWGYGTFPTAGNIIFAGPLVEHEHEEGGKGGPVTVSYTYTRSYAIGICEGPISGLQKIKRNGKLVYDISPTSTITGENAKFLEKCTIYLGDETQNVDPTIEAIVGIGQTGPYRGLAYIVMEDDDLTDTQGAIAQYEFVVQMCGTITEDADYLTSLGPAFDYRLNGDGVDAVGNLSTLVPSGTYSWGADGFELDGTDAYASVVQGPGVTVAGGCAILFKGRLEASTNPIILRLLAGHYNNFQFGFYNWSIHLWGANKRTPGVGIGNLAGAGLALTAPFEIDVGEDFVVGFRVTASDFELWVNGELVDSTPIGASTVGGSARFVVGGGRDYPASYGWTGEAGQLFGLDYAPSDSEMASIALAMDPSSSGYTSIPDLVGAWVDQQGNVITPGVSTQSLSSCSAVLSDVVDDLCRRTRIDVATEVDTSELTDAVEGFKCATESGADTFIESLTMSHFFDRAEWDKKLRFPKRGGPIVAALTMDDVTLRDGAPIEQTRIQEPELLRKVNVLSIDPAADYNVTKQSWERRAGTIRAVGEASVEIPEVVDTDVAAQIAEIRGRIAWAETDKFGFGYSIKWAKLTPTDPITLTDRAGLVHRIRLQDLEEELGAFTVREGIKDRASVYSSSATGVVNTNTSGVTTPGLVGPTIFAAMNLPQMRSQDGAGLYVGMAGMVSGWAGAQLFMSVDGGVSYSPVLTINVPTTMGFLTADLDATGSASEPLLVVVHGGQLSSATSAQVAQGANYSAIETLHGTVGKVAEVLAYETATPTSSVDYNLSVLSRGLKGTAIDNHFEGDVFMDMATSYFLPIDMAYAGQTLYFKPVGFGVSIDAVPAVAVEYAPAERVHDGGGDAL